MTGQDSIQVDMTATVVDTVARQYSKPQTPYQVLRLLPQDATPAQQDSAIQAWLGPREIHYSEQPDTLHLPGERIPRDLKETNIPLYYRENFFSNDSLYHEELKAGGHGIAGDPVPYVLSNDDVITGLLLLCFIFITYALSRTYEFVGRQLKDLIYSPKGEHTITETGNEMKFQLAFLFMTCLVYALMHYLYVKNYITDTFSLTSEYGILLIFLVVFITYFTVRFLLYDVVNLILFDKKRNQKFLTSLLFLSASEGVVLYPNVLLLTYLHLPMLYAVYYLIIVLIIVKILTFYKSYIIFFKQNVLFLQIMLYFCALEIVPLVALWGSLSNIVDIFKIKI